MLRHIKPYRNNDDFGRAEMATEKCPFCGQEIDAAATRCFFCGAELNKESVHKRLEQLHEQRARSARRIHHPVTAGIIVVMIAAVVVLHSKSGKKQIPAIENPSRTSTVRLKAKVTFPGESFVVSNNDLFDWKNVELEIVPESAEERFSLKVPKISAGQICTAAAAEFSREDGTRFNPYEMRPKRFRILCDTPSNKRGIYQAGWK
jgi:tRNA(Ile2) C34 agmatinyltransferase TiaS